MTRPAAASAPAPSPEAPFTLSEGAAPALLGGALWASLGFRGGLALADFAQLAALAGSSLLLARSAYALWSAQRELAAKLMSSVALASLACLAMGMVLHASTNHRPLGAVTWTCAVVAVALALLSLAQRFAPRAGLALGMLGVSSAGLVALAAPSWGMHTWLQIAVGVALTIGLVRGGRLLPTAWARHGWAPLGLLALGTLSAVVTGATERLHEAAPVVAGVFGLLY